MKFIVGLLLASCFMFSAGVVKANSDITTIDVEMVMDYDSQDLTFASSDLNTVETFVGNQFLFSSPLVLTDPATYRHEFEYDVIEGNKESNLSHKARDGLEQI